MEIESNSRKVGQIPKPGRVVVPDTSNPRIPSGTESPPGVNGYLGHGPPLWDRHGEVLQSYEDSRHLPRGQTLVGQVPYDRSMPPYDEPLVSSAAPTLSVVGRSVRVTVVPTGTPVAAGFGRFGSRCDGGVRRGPANQRSKRAVREGEARRGGPEPRPFHVFRNSKLVGQWGTRTLVVCINPTRVRPLGNTIIVLKQEP